MKFGLNTVAAFALFTAMPMGGAGAAVTYSYVGNPFVQFFSSTYNSSENVTLSFTLPSALGDNFNGAVDPTSFTAFDGAATITDGPFSSLIAEIVTNSAGQITEWAILATYSYGTDSQSDSNSHVIFTANGLGDSVAAINNIIGNADSTEDSVALFGCPLEQCEEYAEASTYFNQGSWSAAATGAPEPSTWAMMLLAFAGMGFAAWVRSRYGAKVASVPASGAERYSNQQNCIETIRSRADALQEFPRRAAAGPAPDG